MSLEQRKTPGGQTEGIPQIHHSHLEDVTSSIPHSVDQREMFAQQLNGMYIVVAQVKSPGPEPRYRRRFYASLDSAQRHVDRAVMNGRDAHLFAARLLIDGGDQLG